MKRWWVSFALLLSLGFNLGLLAAVAGGWWAQRGAAGETAADDAAAEAPAEPPPGYQVVAVGDQAAGELGVPIAGVEVEPAPAPAAAGEPSSTPATRAGGAPASPPPGPPADDALGEPPPQGRAEPPPEGFDGPPHGPGGQGPPLDRLADHLGLEGQTRERFVEIQRRFFAVQVEARLRRARLNREMRRELLAAQPDRARVERLIREQAEVFVSVEKATAETILDTRALLTPEQQRRYLFVLERLRAGAPPEGGGPGGPGGPRRRRPPGQRPPPY